MRPSNLVTTADRRRAFVTSPGDDATWEIDPATLRVLRTHPVGGHAGAVSADGRLFALGSQDGSVRLLDLETDDVRRFRGRHEGGGMHLLTFSADASTLVASDDSGEIVVWDVERGAIRERFPGPAGDVYGLAVSSDGRTLYSTAPDARMRIWDLAGDRRLDTRFDAGPPLIIDNQSPKGVALSPDGRTLAVTQVGGTVDLVDARTLTVRHRLRVAAPGGPRRRVQPRRPAAGGHRRGRARDAVGRAHAGAGPGAEGTEGVLPGGRVLARRPAARGRRSTTARGSARSCGTCAPASARPSSSARPALRSPSAPTAACSPPTGTSAPPRCATCARAASWPASRPATSSARSPSAPTASCSRSGTTEARRGSCRRAPGSRWGARWTARRRA